MGIGKNPPRRAVAPDCRASHPWNSGRRSLLSCIIMDEFRMRLTAMTPVCRLSISYHKKPAICKFIENANYCGADLNKALSAWVGDAYLVVYQTDSHLLTPSSIAPLVVSRSPDSISILTRLRYLPIASARFTRLYKNFRQRYHIGQVDLSARVNSVHLLHEGEVLGMMAGDVHCLERSLVPFHPSLQWREVLRVIRHGVGLPCHAALCSQRKRSVNVIESLASGNFLVRTHNGLLFYSAIIFGVV